MRYFIQGEMQLRIKDGISILLQVADALRLFGESLKVSCIAAVPQAYRCPRLIFNLSEHPASDTHSVNETTNREAAPESLQFGWASPRSRLAVWEADLVQGSVWVFKTGRHRRALLRYRYAGTGGRICVRHPMGTR